MLLQNFKHNQLQNSCNSKEFLDKYYQCSTAITSVTNNQNGINNYQSYELFSNDKSGLWGNIKMEPMNILEHSSTFQQESVMQKQQQEEQQVSQNEQSYFNFATTMDYSEGITHKVACARYECHVVSNHIISNIHQIYIQNIKCTSSLIMR